MNEPIDVTEVMRVEEELARELKEWANAGGPVMGVVDRISALIDAKLRVVHPINEVQS